MDAEKLTVVVECEYKDGGGEAYVEGRAEKGSKELDRIIKMARAAADEYVYGLAEAEWATVLLGTGTDIEDVNVETADVIYSVES